MAFAEGHFNDEEFDERMRAALVARTQAELEQYTPVPGLAVEVWDAPV